jgi:hypothetical protein
MLEFRLFVQRRRKLIVRLGVLLALGFGGLVAVMPLPRADAHGMGQPTASPIKLPKGVAMSLLLSPAPVSSERFLSSYELAYP